MSAFKRAFQDIEEFIRENRSLAENNPFHLVGRGCSQLDDMYYHIPKSAFESLVWRILDQAE